MLKEGIEYLHEKFTKPEDYPREIEKWFYKNTGIKFDIEHPETYNEKVQWIKLYYKNPLITTLSDKFLVRDWIKNKIGEEYLVPLLGVYDKFSEIDFDKLPERFVLKANHGSSWNIIVQDKGKFDKLKARMKFFVWMNLNYAYAMGYQLHYVPIKPKIIAEKYLENERGMLRDYKILVFGGKAKYIWVDSDRFTDHRRNVYDLDWNLAPFEIGYPNLPEGYEPPINLKKMIDTGVDGFSIARSVISGKLDFNITNF